MPLYSPYPPPSRSNPFQIPLAEALAQHDWKIKSFNWRPLQLVAHRHMVPILHFHWPESQWRSSRVTISMIKALWWIIRAELSKLLGYKLVWSAHNVMPHFSNSMRLERWMRYYILRRFDLVIGHALNCEADLRITFGRTGKIYAVGVLGVYDGIYQTQRTREQIRASLSLDSDKTVVLLFGSPTPYKGTDIFLQAWRSASVPGCTLLVTGHLSRIGMQQVKTASNVRYIPGWIDNDALAELLNACDYVAIPYQRITTSSMYFLALTFRKPVIAPDLPFFIQHSHPATAVLYDQHDPHKSIADALRRIAEGWQADLGQINTLIQRFNWLASADVIAARYNTLYDAWRYNSE